MMKLNIIQKVSNDWQGWSPNRMPGLSPGGFFEDQDIEIDAATDRFRQIMIIIKQSRIKMTCSSSYEFGSALGRLYFEMTGENIENVNYQEDKYTVSIKTSLILPNSALLTSEFRKFLNCKSLPWKTMFFQDGSRSSRKWLSAGEGATKFAFYLIAHHGVRL